MAKVPSSHDPLVTANAAAVTVAVGYVVCAVFFVVFRDFSMEITKAVFHGLELSLADGRSASINSFALGLVSSVVAAWLMGYLFGLLYTVFAKK